MQVEEDLLTLLLLLIQMVKLLDLKKMQKETFIIKTL